MLRERCGHRVVHKWGHLIDDMSRWKCDWRGCTRYLVVDHVRSAGAWHGVAERG